MTETAPILPRARLAVGVLICVLVVVAITLLYRLDVTALDRVDRGLEQGPQSFTFSHPAVTRFLLVVQDVFTTLPMAIYTALTVAVLLVRRHGRAALFVVVVMVGSSMTTYFLKGLLHRKRPVWTDPVTTLGSFSYPSGHATGIAAAAGVMIVLATLFARGGPRTLLVATALALALLVGLDRVFLGVHNPSDVLAGLAVGVAWVLGMLVLLPLRRRGTRPSQA